MPDNKKGCVVIEISNSGTVIDSNMRDRIFDPFITTKKGGTGLGLAITHQIVSMHQGVISFDSRDGLTVFTLKFPLLQNNKGVNHG